MNAKFEPRGEDNKPVVDLEHLIGFACQDDALAARFLRLFMEQSTRDLEKLETSVDEDNWCDGAHSLKSSASGIGAWALVETCDAAMNEIKQLDGRGRRDHLNILIARVQDVTNFIENYLSHDRSVS